MGNYKLVPEWAKIGHPKIMARGIDADSTGRILVTGDAEHPVMMLSPEGEFLGSWGQEVLPEAHGLRVQGETIWVTDLTLHMILQFTVDGELIRSFGEERVAGDSPEHFNKPTDFAFGPDGAIYVSDGYINTRVVCLNPDGSFRKIWGKKGSGPGEFNLVHSLVIDETKRVYVADRENHRIQIFDLDGKYLTEWSHIGVPYTLYVGPDGAIFMCGLEPGAKRFRVLKLSIDGEILADFGETGNMPGQFEMAHSIFVDKSGGVFVADGMSMYVQKFVAE